MNFIDTRGGSSVSGAEAIVHGMAEGGGLYVPESFPPVTEEEFSAMLGMSYPERAALIIRKYFDVPQDELLQTLEAAYAKFEGDDPVPLVKIEDGLFILELFHGPTCAFKDMALSVLPYLLRKSCESLGVKEKILILTATSGDTGKAALEGFAGVDGVKIAVFYPDDGVSKMQKLQLVTQDGDNVDVVAVKGNFDDCQSAVKKIFRSAECREKLREKGFLLSSANSINIGRLVPQIAYYFSAYCDLVTSEQIKAGEEVDFAVPTGNFGNILAAYYAQRMGLPVGTLVCASNRNNALTDFFRKGTYDKKRPFFRTMSPSMDILISSNLERLLFELCGRDPALVVERMRSLKSAGRYSLRAEELKAAGEYFYAGCAGEEETVECVYEFFEEFNYPLDTHTGVAMHVAREYCRKRAEDANAELRPMVVVSTASPYKCPQAVYYALTGNDVKDSFKGVKRIHLITAMKVPDSLKALRYKPPRFKTVISPDKIMEEVMNFAS